ncbi:hypothetical protein V7654_15445 [Bacillus sp. JJ1609]|uniref:hypothetical protein n=1 Tax=Bacillus sp. JJ1609 TaxID=3122977 RepID=UPI00300020A7
MIFIEQEKNKEQAEERCCITGSVFSIATIVKRNSPYRLTRNFIVSYLEGMFLIKIKSKKGKVKREQNIIEGGQGK